MKTLHFWIMIDAPKNKVWHTMLDEVPYRDWTTEFSPGSYYRGDWSEGSKVLFLGPDPETGSEGGMVSLVAENRPYEFVSILHLGVVQDEVEDTTSELARQWAPAYENYTFREKGASTEVQVDIDVTEDYVPMFEEMWLRALSRLKELAEQ